jgi:Flp pilus assembly protein TadB
MDDQRADPDGQSGLKLLPDDTPRRALPLTVLLLFAFIVLYWCQPNFWTLKGVVGMCFVVALLIWDRFRVKPKMF